jgi:hypothetical protein
LSRRRCARLKWLLLKGLLLELLTLMLTRKTGHLRLLGQWWLLLLLLLSEALRLSRKACELRLQWASSKSSGLGAESTLKAAGLLERLLLLAILRLPRSGAVGTP